MSICKDRAREMFVRRCQEPCGVFAGGGFPGVLLSLLYLRCLRRFCNPLCPCEVLVVGGPSISSTFPAGMNVSSVSHDIGLNSKLAEQFERLREVRLGHTYQDWTMLYHLEAL